jgi:hypothetical protein
MRLDRALRGWAGCALFQRWLAVLNVALQQALFESARAAWGEAPCPCLLPACLPFAGSSAGYCSEGQLI